MVVKGKSGGKSDKMEIVKVTGAIITSKNSLFNSTARFFFILKLQETIPPKALTGSHANAYLKLSIWFDFIETPQGFACFTITVPIFFGKDFEIVNAAKISL